MPDWHFEEDYKFTYSLNNRGWAWEFLRRNQEYIQDWKKATIAQKQFEKHQAGCPANFHLNPYAIFEPPIPVGGHPLSWSIQPGVQLSSPAQFFGHKWRLAQHIQDPSISTPPDFQKAPCARVLDWDELAKYYAPAADSSDTQLQNGSIAVIGIDLSRSLSAILEEVTALVKNQSELRGTEKLGQKHFKKKGNWQLYLRIMDAQTAGEPQSSIAKVLLPEKGGLTDGNVAIGNYIKSEIAKLSNPHTLALLANEPD